MPFNMLVVSCYHQGTSFHDSGDSPKISIAPKRDIEKIVFFRIDDSGKIQTPFRQYFSMNRDNEKICDLLIFYKNLKTQKDYLILAETKGEEFEEAADQIINTYKKMTKNHFFCDNSHCQNLIIRACCVSKKMNKYANTDAKKAKKKIIDTIKIDKNDCDFVDPNDFIRFLRGEVVITR